MDITKVKLNPIAIKNYLFEIGLISGIKSNQMTIKIGDKQSLETHISLYLNTDEKDVKEDNTSEEFEELTPDTDNGGDGQDDNVEENPKTGSILFFLALIIGFSALGYSIYYFKNREKFTV